MNTLLASFFEQYGLIIILVVAFVGMMVYYYVRNKKYQQTEVDFQTKLKKGDKVKTYSGFYGEVEKITETTDGKVVTLKLGENCYIDVDIRALMAIDSKREIVDEPKVETTVAEESVEPKVEETPKAETPAEEKAEEPEHVGAEVNKFQKKIQKNQKKSK